MTARGFTALVTDSTSAIRDALKSEGVIAVRSAAGPSHPSLTLVTRLESEALSIASRGFLASEVRSILIARGVHVDDADRVYITTESQEVVDRDFGGDWQAAMR